MGSEGGLGRKGVLLLRDDKCRLRVSPREDLTGLATERSGMQAKQKFVVYSELENTELKVPNGLSGVKAHLASLPSIARLLIDWYLELAEDSKKCAWKKMRMAEGLLEIAVAKIGLSRVLAVLKVNHPYVDEVPAHLRKI